eukprot:5679805-Amphidinium_carterae.2
MVLSSSQQSSMTFLSIFVDEDLLYYLEKHAPRLIYLRSQIASLKVVPCREVPLVRVDDIRTSCLVLGILRRKRGKNIANGKS